MSANVALRVVLWLVAVRIRWLCGVRRSFRHAIRTAGQVVQFTTRDGRVSRYYQFEQGRFRSAATVHPKSSVAATLGLRGERILVFTFQDGATGLGVLRQALRDDHEILRAMGDGRLTLVGDFTLFIWLGGLMKRL